VGTDTYERQQAVRARIEQAKDFARAVDEAATGAAAAAGQGIDDVDPRGSLRAALPGLASIARSRPDFEVVLADAGATVGFRVGHLHGEVDIVVVPVIAVSPMGRTAGAGATAETSAASVAPSDGVAADLASVLWGEAAQEK
jgi:hypothetical protein